MIYKSPPPHSSDSAATGSRRHQKVVASTPHAARRIRSRPTSTTFGRVVAPTRTRLSQSASQQGLAIQRRRCFLSMLTTALRWTEPGAQEHGTSESSTTTTRLPSLCMGDAVGAGGATTTAILEVCARSILLSFAGNVELRPILLRRANWHDRRLSVGREQMRRVQNARRPCAHFFSFLLLFATPPLVVVWTFADL